MPGCGRALGPLGNHSYGNTLTTTDARGIVTQYEYQGACPNAYVTKITQAFGTEDELVTEQGWDCPSGRMTSTTDANSVVTNREYDALGRLTRVTDAVGTPSQRLTTISYADLDRRVTTAKDLSASGDQLLQTIQQFDRRGRIALSKNTVELDPDVQGCTSGPASRHAI